MEIKKFNYRYALSESMKKFRGIWAASLIFGAVAGCVPKTEEYEPGPAPPPKVSVYNGGGNLAAATEVARRCGLPADNVKARLDSTGRIIYDVKITSVRAARENSAYAEEVLRRIGFGVMVLRDEGSDIDVIVGRDAPNALGWREPALPEGVLVDVSERTVRYYENGEVRYVWPCAVGAPESPTPTGEFKVTVVLEKPTWYWRGRAIPPGPENGLGDWFIGINKKGYGIHGTNEPDSIGKPVSHGCVRMYNDDAAKLAQLVKIGTPVLIVD